MTALNVTAATTGHRLRQLVVVALAAALLVPALLAVLRPLLQTASAGRPLSGPGGVPLPSQARLCPLSPSRVPERALQATLTSYCFPSQVSSAELARWTARYIPSSRDLSGAPFCERQVLSDGARLYRWGRASTFGFLRSEPAKPTAWFVIVSAAPAC